MGSVTVAFVWRPVDEVVAMTSSDCFPLKEYVGFIWIGDAPGVRLSIMARSPEEAEAVMEAEYGSGHVYSLWNEEDASRPR